MMYHHCHLWLLWKQYGRGSLSMKVQRTNKEYHIWYNTAIQPRMANRDLQLIWKDFSESLYIEEHPYLITVSGVKQLALLPYLLETSRIRCWRREDGKRNDFVMASGTSIIQYEIPWKFILVCSVSHFELPFHMWLNWFSSVVRGKPFRPIYHAKGKPE